MTDIIKIRNPEDQKQLDQFRRILREAPKTTQLEIALELQIIALSLVDKEFFWFCKKLLKPEHLENEYTRKVWKYILDYMKKYNSVPNRDVLQHFWTQEFGTNEPLYIPVVDKTMADYVKVEIMDFVRLQLFDKFALFSAMAGNRQQKGKDMEENLMILRKMLDEMIQIKPDERAGTNYFEAKERWDRFMNFWTNRISTGFPSLDVCLPGGGIGRKELICFMGPSGVGKCCHKITNVEIELNHYKLTCTAERVVKLKREFPKIEINILSETGYRRVKNAWITQPNPEWYVKLESGECLLCADDHKIDTPNGFMTVQSLKNGDLVKTKKGESPIMKVHATGNTIPMVDFSVEGQHYYADGILSHNSLWLCNLGVNLIKNGYKVIHFTREISEEITAMRYDACLLKKTTDELVGNPDKTVQEIGAMRQKIAATLQGSAVNDPLLFIKEFPTSGADLDDSKAYAAMLFERHGFKPDVIIDDYLDIAKPTRAMKSRYEEQGLTFGEFRGWMVEEYMSGITATQTVRGAEKSRGFIGMDKTADSIDKVRVVDVFATINETYEDMIAGQQKIFFAKNRNQKSLMIANFRVDKSRMLIEDMNDYYNITERRDVQQAIAQGISLDDGDVI